MNFVLKAQWEVVRVKYTIVSNLKKKKKVSHIILAGKNPLIQVLSLYLNHMLQINPTLDFKSHYEELFKELLLL